MDNIRIEQLFKVNPPKNAKIWKGIMILLVIASGYLLFTKYGLIGLAAMIVFIIGTVVLFQYYDAEYEYTLVENTLTIDRIFSKSHRRNCAEYDLMQMEALAPAGSDSISSYEKRTMKRVDYSSNTDGAKTYILFVQGKNEMIRVVLEPNEEMKEAIWKMAPRKVTL